MKFYTGIHELIFEDNAQYPAKRPMEKMQAMDRSAAGILHVESFAVKLVRRELVFDLMTEVDYLALASWYDEVADGAKNSFFFEDEDGNIGEVRITSNIYDFQEQSYKRFAGTLMLEYC